MIHKKRASSCNDRRRAEDKPAISKSPPADNDHNTPPKKIVYCTLGDWPIIGFHKSRRKQ